MSVPNVRGVESLILSKRISQDVQVALLTALIYDTITTLEQEVKYVWSCPRNLVSIIYLANRYIGIFGAICGVASKTFLVKETIKWSELLADWATFILIEYILLMRVLALYSRGKTVTRILRTLFALEATYTLALLVYVVIYEKVGVVTLSEDFEFCGGVGDNRAIPKSYAAAWIPPLMYDLIFMILSLYKAVQFWRESAGSTGTDLVKVLIQDQALYFGLLIINTLAQILSEVLKPSMFTVFLSVMGNPLILCIIGSHLVINMKEAGEKGENGGLTDSAQSVSDIEFA